MNDLVPPRCDVVGESNAAGNHKAIGKILVIVNPAAYRHPCVEKAARIAAHAGGAIELFACEVESNLPNSWVSGDKSLQAYKQLLRKRRLDDVEQMAESVRVDGLQVSVTAEWHTMSEPGILQHVVKSKPDLIIKDASLRGTLTRSTGQRTAWILTHQIATPVLLVHSKPWPPQPVIVAALKACGADERRSSLEDALIVYVQSLSKAVDGEWVDTYPLRDKQSMTSVTEQHRADILAIGVAARSRDRGPPGAATVSQILDSIECDLLIVKAFRKDGALSAARGLRQ